MCVDWIYIPLRDYKILLYLIIEIRALIVRFDESKKKVIGELCEQLTIYELR